jgi:hypothetical protein
MKVERGAERRNTFIILDISTRCSFSPRPLYSRGKTPRPHHWVEEGRVSPRDSLHFVDIKNVPLQAI